MEVLTGFVRRWKATTTSTTQAASVYSRVTRRVFNLPRQVEFKATARFGSDIKEHLAPGYYVGWFARFDRATRSVVPFVGFSDDDEGYCRVLVQVFPQGRYMTLAMRNAGSYVPEDEFSLALALTRIGELTDSRATVVAREAETAAGLFVRRFAVFSLRARAVTTMQAARSEMLPVEQHVLNLSPKVVDWRVPGWCRV